MRTTLVFARIARTNRFKLCNTPRGKEEGTENMVKRKSGMEENDCRGSNMGKDLITRGKDGQKT
jgi:hypothetical protein